MISAKEKAIKFIEAAGGLIRTNEALERGIHRRTLYGLRDEGTLIQISRGLYQLADIEIPALSQSAHKDQFILKGGLLIYGMELSEARPTRDIDFLGLTQNNIEAVTNFRVADYL